jgi:hypothetical protein
MAAIEGPIHNIKAQQEGSDFVLRFLVEREGARSIPVEMRGTSLIGVLNDGDRVQFNADMDHYNIARPLYVVNLDNGSIVLFVQPSLSKRVRRLGGTIAVPVFTSVLSGVLVFALTSLFTLNSDEPLGSFTSSSVSGTSEVPTSTTPDEATTSSAESTTTTGHKLQGKSSESRSRPLLLPLVLALITAVFVFLLARAWQERHRDLRV